MGQVWVKNSLENHNNYMFNLFPMHVNVTKRTLLKGWQPAASSLTFILVQDPNLEMKGASGSIVANDYLRNNLLQ